MTDMTPGELTRAVQNLQRREADLIRKDFYERDMHEIRRDIEEIKDGQRWMMRLLVTQFFGAIIALVIYLTQAIP